MAASRNMKRVIILSYKYKLQTTMGLRAQTPCDATITLPSVHCGKPKFAARTV